MRLLWDVEGLRRVGWQEPPGSLRSGDGRLPEKPQKHDGGKEVGGAIQLPGRAENQGFANDRRPA